MKCLGESNGVRRTHLLPIHADEHGYWTRPVIVHHNAIEEERVYEMVTPDRVNQRDLLRFRPYNAYIC